MLLTTFQPALYLNGDILMLAALIGLILYYALEMKKWKLVRVILFSLFVLYLVKVIDLTLFPIPLNQRAIEVENLYFDPTFLITLAPIKTITRDVYLNILMTIPLGVFLNLLYRKTKFIKHLSNTFILILCIEIIQLILSFTLRSNSWSFDLNDIVFNLLGFIIGYFIAWLSTLFVLRITDTA